VVGFEGELKEKKGLGPLLSAYMQVNKKIQAALLIVRDVRAGDNRQIFEEFRYLHPDTQTIVTGYVSPDDLPAYNSLIDVLVLPSLRDGLPNASSKRCLAKRL
jgi:glycosyltransferase involved in cell wall biosynthesis